MTKLVTLVSKKFTGGEFEKEFTAAGNKLKAFIEKRENIHGISIFLKGKTSFIHLGTLHASSFSNLVSEHNLIKGETYKLSISSAGASKRDEEGNYNDLPSIVEVSAVWEDS